MIKSVLLTVQSDTPDTKVLKVAADASEVKSTSSMGISSSSLKNNIQFGINSGSKPCSGWAGPFGLI